MPSLVMAVVTVLGIAVLLDGRSRSALSPAIRPLAALLAAIVAWQGLGVLLRGDMNAEDAAALASSVAIVMLLPVAALAARREGAIGRFLLLLFSFGLAAAVLSLALHLNGQLHGGNPIRSILAERLVPFGRARHAILGAGGIAASFLAGLALIRSGGLRRTIALPGLAVMAATLLLTQSRGPIIALALATVALLAIDHVPLRRRALAALAFAGACFALPVALVLLEPWLTSMVCAGGTGVCRPSQRQDMWYALTGMIRERPWFGWGPSFRLGADTVGHAHNGLLGTAFFFGLPMAAMFLAAFGHALVRGAGQARGPVRDFVIGGLCFAAGFIGSDLPNPFAFFNTHYLFLWLPLVLGVVSATSEQEGLP
ncbi:O-antigen ligase family protein [Salinarimonas soli]|uniref:O-antigen ligase family protein n=1 Tax=Salinarimonas soli TaxID=1638099 RepID=UPI00166195F9|nr:O-antigen ligase family protein [Salinarimonas soli]